MEEVREYSRDIAGVNICVRAYEDESGLHVELRAGASEALSQRAEIIRFVGEALNLGSMAQLLIGVKFPKTVPDEPIEMNLWGTTVKLDSDNLVVKLANVGFDTIRSILGQ